MSNGRFLVGLNGSAQFGAGAFTDNERYVQVAAQCTGDTRFTTLSPRQKLTSAPHALYSKSAPWSGLSSVPTGFADRVDDDTTYGAGTGLCLSGTIDQADAGELTGGGYTLGGGFWDRADAASVRVVNTADGSDYGACDAVHCSLREAITAANARAGQDTVAFNIPPADPGFNTAGWWTIRPASPLPELIDDGTTIDGTTQTANRGDTNLLGPEIELDGSLVSGRSQGLVVTSAKKGIHL